MNVIWYAMYYTPTREGSKMNVIWDTMYYIPTREGSYVLVSRDTTIVTQSYNLGFHTTLKLERVLS